jgi:hypothetical protein
MVGRGGEIRIPKTSLHHGPHKNHYSHMLSFVLSKMLFLVKGDAEEVDE